MIIKSKILNALEALCTPDLACPQKMHRGALRGAANCSEGIARALNAADGAEHATAICMQLPDTLPEFLPVIPAGRIKGVDGRSWVNDKPEDIVAAFNSTGLDVPVDYNHSTELAAPKGRPAPAAGWIKKLMVRDGAVCAQIDWNEDGAADIKAKRFRYYSPAFDFEKGTGRIAKLTSVGLTNTPNLEVLPALNSQEDHPVKFATAILTALGITNTEAGEAEVLTTINSIKSDKEKAVNSQQNSVPKAELERAINRADKAEGELAKLKQDTVNAEIDRVLDEATRAGKITPATRDYHKAICAQEKGLEKFAAWLKDAPVIGSGTGLDNKKKPGTGGTGRASNFQAPPGYKVDADQANLHERALNYQAEHKCTYEAAVRAVS